MLQVGREVQLRLSSEDRNSIESQVLNYPINRAMYYATFFLSPFSVRPKYTISKSPGSGKLILALFLSLDQVSLIEGVNRHISGISVLIIELCVAE